MKKTLIPLLLLSFILSASAQTDRLNNLIIKSANSLSDNHFSIYTDLHANPELSLMEFETAKKMAAELTKMGF
jgi:hypothetical protein